MTEAHIHIDERTIDDVKQSLPDFVDANLTKSHGKFYVCPFCRSGAKANGTGALIVDRDNNPHLWHCFSCHEGGDIFTLIEKLDNVSFYDAVLKAVNAYRNGELPSVSVDHHDRQRKPAKTPEEIRAEADAFEAALRGSAGEKYLLSRGIDAAAQMRFHLGYDAGRNAIVIPYSPMKAYYTERRIDPKAKGNRHCNLAGVAVPLYNRAALQTGEQFIFVTEAALDAISIMCAGGTAVALTGTDGEKLIAELQRTQYAGKILLCLDNDDPGREAADELYKKLQPLGIEVVDVAAVVTCSLNDDDHYVRPDRKDANEVLQWDGVDVLRQRIARAIEYARDGEV